MIQASHERLRKSRVFSNRRSVRVAPVCSRIAVVLVSVPTISRDSKGGWLEESTLIPVSCFRNAREQAKKLKAGEKITVIARLRGSKFTIENGTEKHGIQLLAERVFEHSKSRAVTDGVDVVLDISGGSPS